MPEGSAEVLLVEDEALIRLGAALALEEAGYRVFEAGSADEAIAVLEANSGIRVVVTDIHMPGTMDGLKLSHYVRDRWPPIALIVVSGEPGDFYSRVPPGTMFCSKPVTDERLVSSVSVALAATAGQGSRSGPAEGA